VVTDPSQALEAAPQMAKPEDAVFATGSLFLVGELRAYWHRRKIEQNPVASGPLSH
jgi:hypothetical protein